MTAIFLFGTLCHAPLLHAVAGTGLSERDAVLPDAEVTWVDGKPWPMLVDRPGARAAGLLIRPDAAALARLDFYEACFGYHRVPVTVEVAGTTEAAEAWRPAGPGGRPGAAWALSDWAEKWGELTVLAAAEVMRHHGKTDPALIGRRFWMILARAQAFLEAGRWQRPGLLGRGLTRRDVRIEAHRHPYDGFFTVEELRLRARRFDGRMSPPQVRAVFRVADAATVLPYDPLRDRILLIEQVRFGALANGDAAPWLLEPIAGIVDAGESPADSARREALEEAGVTIGALHHVARYYPSPGGVAQVITSYVGIADLPDGVTGVNGAEGEEEDILSHVVGFDEALALFEGGDLVNAPLILTFQWLMMNRDRLREAT